MSCPRGGVPLARWSLSELQSQVLTPNDFASLADVKDRLLRFQDHDERAATPFQWTFTRQDFAALLVKLAAKDRLAIAA